MIDEVLDEIRNAEAKADQKQKDAYQQGKDIVLQAEFDAAKLKKQTVLDCKQSQKDAALEAEKKANMAREAILKNGKQNSEKLVDDKNSAIEDAANKIVEELLAKYKK